MMRKLKSLTVGGKAPQDEQWQGVASSPKMSVTWEEVSFPDPRVRS